MTKRLINIVECVFAGGVFEGQWVGLDEVEVVESFQKQMVPNNRFITVQTGKNRPSLIDKQSHSIWINPFFQAFRIM